MELQEQTGGTWPPAQGRPELQGGKGREGPSLQPGEGVGLQGPWNQTSGLQEGGWRNSCALKAPMWYSLYLAIENNNTKNSVLKKWHAAAQ